jgi:putative Mg2+ transporter-C (MgtC) family protein
MRSDGTMTVNLTWWEIALRLALTLVAAILIGYNRSQHGKAAGISTSVLVCLAASVAMIQVNLLLPTAGRPASSFVMNDLMRLPLGILTGVGFIGAGAILRRESLVIGVTTAATLWMLTVIGLCLGGGQIVLGLVATLLCLFALWTLKALENHLQREYRARLTLQLDSQGPDDEEVRQWLIQRGLVIARSRIRLRRNNDRRDLVFEVRYLRRTSQTEMPSAVKELAGRTGIVSLEWRNVS